MKISAASMQPASNYFALRIHGMMISRILADEVLRIINRTEALSAATERLAAWLRVRGAPLPREEER